MDMKSSNPKKAYGTLKPGIQFIPPVALLEEGVVMALGAKKYGPFNWHDSPVDATTYVDAAFRHLMSWYTREDNDPESGASHLAHARACMGILIDSYASGILIDDRPKTTSAAETIKRLTKKEATSVGETRSASEPTVEKLNDLMEPHPIVKGYWQFRGKMYGIQQLRDFVTNGDCDCDDCTASRKFHELEAMSVADFSRRFNRHPEKWKLDPMTGATCDCPGCTAARIHMDKFIA